MSTFHQSGRNGFGRSQCALNIFAAHPQSSPEANPILLDRWVSWHDCWSWRNLEAAQPVRAPASGAVRIAQDGSTRSVTVSYDELPAADTVLGDDEACYGEDVVGYPSD